MSIGYDQGQHHAQFRRGNTEEYNGLLHLDLGTRAEGLGLSFRTFVFLILNKNLCIWSVFLRRARIYI